MSTYYNYKKQYICDICSEYNNNIFFGYINPDANDEAYFHNIFDSFRAKCLKCFLENYDKNIHKDNKCSKLEHSIFNNEIKCMDIYNRVWLKSGYITKKYCYFDNEEVKKREFCELKLSKHNTDMLNRYEKRVLTYLGFENMVKKLNKKDFCIYTLFSYPKLTEKQVKLLYDHLEKS